MVFIRAESLYESVGLPVEDRLVATKGLFPFIPYRVGSLVFDFMLMYLEWKVRTNDVLLEAVLQFREK